MPVTLDVSICTICGGALAARVEICYACAIAYAAIASRAAVARPSSADDAVLSTPPVLTVRDFAALERFARLQLRPDDPAAEALLEKLSEAQVVPTGTLARDFVALGARVIFSVDDGPPETRLLVLPTQHAAAGWTLPVTAPRGLALLGRPAGAVAIADRPGSVSGESLRILAVMHRAKPTVAPARRGDGASGLRRGASPLPRIHRPLPRPASEGRTLADGEGLRARR